MSYVGTSQWYTKRYKFGVHFKLDTTKLEGIRVINSKLLFQNCQML